MKVVRVAALATALLATGAHGGERARIENVKTEWQNAYGAIIYTVLARVQNLSDAPIRYVKVKVQLVDKNGNPVAERLGYNAQAEILEVIIEGAEAEPLEQRLSRVKAIAPGGSDLVRLSFDKKDIGKPFRQASVVLVEVH